MSATENEREEFSIPSVRMAIRTRVERVARLPDSWFGGVEALSLAMCLIQRADGTKVVRPFRGLRKVYRGLDETTLLKVVIMRMLEDGYQGNGQDSRSEI
jgi:hypothetical protein